MFSLSQNGCKRHLRGLERDAPVSVGGVPLKIGVATVPETKDGHFMILKVGDVLKFGSVYKSKPGQGETRYVIPVGWYDSERIVYSEGQNFGNRVFFAQNARHYVMARGEFESCFMPAKD